MVLRFCGLSGDKTFCKYHRFLSRARWNSLKAARILLTLLTEAFCAPGQPLIFGIDETTRAKKGRQDKGQRYLPGSGALIQCPLCKVQRPAVDVPDVAHPHSLDR
jgi:hypothetical protein